MTTDLTFTRPKYRVYDRLLKRWWKPTHRANRGELEDMALLPNGELVMRTLDTPAIHESLFQDRYVVVPELSNFSPGVN